MASPVITFPDYFDDDAPIIESKGYFADLTVEWNGRSYRPVFYSVYRLMQEIRDAVDAEGVFSEEDLVIIETLTRESIEAAVAKLARQGFRSLNAAA